MGDTGHGAIAADVQPSQQSTFESKPAESVAEVGYGKDTVASDLNEAQGNSTFESSPELSRADTGHGAIAADVQPSKQSTFESKPAESVAEVGYGKDTVASDLNTADGSPSVF